MFLCIIKTRKPSSGWQKDQHGCPHSGNKANVIGHVIRQRVEVPSKDRPENVDNCLYCFSLLLKFDLKTSRIFSFPFECLENFWKFVYNLIIAKLYQ